MNKKKLAIRMYTTLKNLADYGINKIKGALKKAFKS